VYELNIGKTGQYKIINIQYIWEFDSQRSLWFVKIEKHTGLP
jgi:hypothetical protein